MGFVLFYLFWIGLFLFFSLVLQKEGFLLPAQPREIKI